MIIFMLRRFRGLLSRFPRPSANIALLWALGALAFAGLGVRCSSGDAGRIPTKGVQRIGQFRTILEDGGIPGDNTLHPRDYFTTHDLELPADSCDEPVCPTAMISLGQDWVRGAYQLGLHLGLASPRDATPVGRAPLDLVVVVQSFREPSDALDAIRRGLGDLIDRLEPFDRLGIVTYDEHVNTVVDLADGAAPELLRQQASAIGGVSRPDGPLAAALEAGFIMAEQAFEPGRQRRVVLVTDDADPGTGRTRQEVLDLADWYIGDGIALSTIGLDAYFDEDLLRKLAERGGGNFHFQEHVPGLGEALLRELSYVAIPVAFDLDLQVSPGPAYRFGESFGASSWRQSQQTGRLAYPAVFRTNTPGEPLRPGGWSGVLLRMIPTGATVSSEDGHRVADVQLSYVAAGGIDVTEQHRSVRNPLNPGEVHTTFVSDPAMELRAALLNLLLGLREASRFAQVDHASALWVLEQLRPQASAWQQQHPEHVIANDLLLIDLFIANLRDRQVGARDPGPRLPDYYYQDDGDVEFWYLFDPLQDLWYADGFEGSDDWDDYWSEGDSWNEDDYWGGDPDPYEPDDYDWYIDDDTDSAGCLGDDEYGTYDDSDDAGCDGSDEDDYYEDDFFDDSAGCEGEDDSYDDSAGCEGEDDSYYDDSYDSSGCDGDDGWDDYGDDSGCEGDSDWGDGWDDTGEGCSVRGDATSLPSMLLMLLVLGFLVRRRRR